jgi:anti-sigma factor RsiW
MSHLGRRLSALIDDELDHVDRDRVLVHLARCEPCRAEAVALRMLKRRMNALGGAAADSTLMQRLMGLAMSGDLGTDGRSIWEPGWPWPAGAAANGIAVRELRPGRLTLAGFFALLLVSLGAAAFAAGGGGQQPGPRVTPAVDMYMLQHDIITGAVPASRPSPVPSAGISAPTHEP